MKVYVDRLPKCCEECPMCRSGKLKLQRKGRYVEVEQCVFGQYKYQTIDDEIDTCPLQSLSDYTKQVRKEVCEEIKKILLEQRRETNKQIVEDISNDVSYWTGRLDCLDVFEFEVLDQIQGDR